jgi:hypothetical protein
MPQPQPQLPVPAWSDQQPLNRKMNQSQKVRFEVCWIGMCEGEVSWELEPWEVTLIASATADSASLVRPTPIKPENQPIAVWVCWRVLSKVYIHVRMCGGEVSWELEPMYLSYSNSSWYHLGPTCTGTILVLHVPTDIKPENWQLTMNRHNSNMFPSILCRFQWWCCWRFY